MTIAWEKIVVWVLGIIILIVLLAYLVSQLGTGSESIATKLFRAFNSTGKTGP